MNPVDICAALGCTGIAHAICVVVAAMTLAGISYIVGHRKGSKQGGGKENKDDVE